MKLDSFLLPCVAGIVTAHTEPRQAEAYILRQTQTTTTSNVPSIPDELAEAILLQRLSSPSRPSTLGRSLASIDEDAAVSYIHQFGVPTRPLFEQADANEPHQLVIAFSGMTSDVYDTVKAAISRVPLGFTAPRLSHLSAARSISKCAFGPSINPRSEKCWDGKTQYLHYDLTKDRNVITQLGLNLASLKSDALSGQMETTIVLLAPPSSSKPDELRRRDVPGESEEVMSLADPSFATDQFDDTKNLVSAVPDPDKPFHILQDGGSDNDKGGSKKPTVIPSCFASHSACMNATSDCSGHGECVDRFGKSGTNSTCFFCYCERAPETDEKGLKHVYRWGGAMCQKRDVSTPFWLFAGVSIALVATVAFSIGLLFSVGEEKLPGVIGAGVSRSK